MKTKQFFVKVGPLTPGGRKGDWSKVLSFMKGKKLSEVAMYQVFVPEPSESATISFKGTIVVTVLYETTSS